MCGTETVQIHCIPTYVRLIYIHTYQLDFRKTLELERERHHTDLEVLERQMDAEKHRIRADKDMLEKQLVHERSEKERGTELQRKLERERDNARMERDILERQIFADREILEKQIMQERLERERLHRELKTALSARETGRRGEGQYTMSVDGQMRTDQAIRLLEEEVAQVDDVLRLLRGEVVKTSSRCVSICLCMSVFLCLYACLSVSVCLYVSVHVSLSYVGAS
jgi:hypothetical protein